MLNKQMVIFINFPLFQVPNSLQRAFENGDDDMGNHLSMAVFMGYHQYGPYGNGKIIGYHGMIYRQFDMIFGIV
jgi:hypothetical protein